MEISTIGIDLSKTTEFRDSLNQFSLMCLPFQSSFKTAHFINPPVARERPAVEDFS
jgi:hypothetical protein